jgi:hypothetical protein
LQGAGTGRFSRTRIAPSRDAITWLPIHFARTLGYYQQEGLAPTVHVVGLSKGMEALLGGSVDAAGASIRWCPG